MLAARIVCHFLCCMAMYVIPGLSGHAFTGIAFGISTALAECYSFSHVGSSRANCDGVGSSLTAEELTLLARFGAGILTGLSVPFNHVTVHFWDTPLCPRTARKYLPHECTEGEDETGSFTEFNPDRKRCNL